MSIVWDAPLVSAVATTLEEKLAAGERRGARLRAIRFDFDALAAFLWFRNLTLTVRLHPEEGEVFAADPADPPADARRLASDLRSVECPPDDRLIVLRLRRARGRREPLLIAIELMTNQWNLIVASGEDHRIRHVLRPRTAGDRRLEVGAAYRRPPPSERAGAVEELSRSEWEALLGDPSSSGARRRLLSRVAWSSSINADALLDEGGYGLWLELRDAARSPRPVVLDLDGTSQPYPLALPGHVATECQDLFRAFEVSGGEKAPSKSVPEAWVRAVERRAEGASARLGALRRELKSAPDASAIRARGDLLLARFNEIEKGASGAVLEDFSGDTVRVELDPALTPQENARELYRRAAKAERAAEKLPAMIAEAEQEAERLDALLSRVRSGDVEADELRRELPPSPGPADPRTRARATLPYRRYRSTGGLEIRVGRGSKENDDLTFHHARPDDVWLHAQHVPGAHVVLRWTDDQNPPSSDLLEAATMAALYSKAHTSGSVPVAWTRRKYVRKPRGSPPGTVVPDRVTTVFVTPDRAVERRLRDE